MFRARRSGTALVAFTILAVACGGAAAPTATRAPAAPAATTAAPAATPTLPGKIEAAALSTPTPTRVGPTAAPRVTGPVGKMVMAATADITNADPHVATGGGLQAFYQTEVFSTLLTTIVPGPVVPWLAESWSWDEKGVKARFVIRKGAKFQDGSPVTSDAMAFTVQKIKDPYSARGVNSSSARIIKEVQVIDERTAVCVSPEVLATFYSSYCGSLVIQPRHSPYETMQRNTIGSGPYRVAEWRPFESITMEANPYWWDADKVQVKTIVRLVVPEPESRLAMLKAGQIDFMDEVQPRQADVLFKDPRFRVKVTDAGTNASIIFATDTPLIPGTDVPNPFLDIRVRKAFIMALDRKAIFDGVALGKYGTYVPGPWSPTTFPEEEKKITPYPYDPQAARKLLEEARFDFGREWPVWVYRTSAGLAESAEVAVAQWNAIGVKARFRLTEVGTLMSYWQERPSRTYPMQFIRTGINDLGGAAGYLLFTENVPEGSLSQNGDPKLDEWAVKLRTAFNDEERIAIYKELYQYIHEKAYTTPLLGGVLIHAFNQRVDYSPRPGTQSITHFWRTQWMPGAP